MKDNRIGRFTIDLGIINHKPEVARYLLRDMLVHRAECLEYAHLMEYVAAHPEFAELTRYATVPEYTCDLTKTWEGENNDIEVIKRGPWRIRNAS